MITQIPEKTHFEHFLRLIELEGEAEKLEALREMQQLPGNAELTGNCLVDLVVRDQDAGVGGSILLTFGKKNQQLELPWTSLRPGSPVLFSEEIESSQSENRAGWRGVVSRIQEETIQVAFTDWPEPILESGSSRSTFRLDKANDEISRQRQRQALERARDANGKRLAVIRDVLLGKQLPNYHPVEHNLQISPGLNASQVEAVRFALSAQDVAIIHGPPGTGKTTTLVEFICQIVRMGQSALVIAPSNLAVDNLLEKLLAAGELPLRLGNPVRVLPELQHRTLDGVLENHPDIKLARKISREAFALRTQASKFTRARPQPGERQALRQEARDMLADARKIEDQVVRHLISTSSVICATATGLDARLLSDRHFDWCILDEASQGTEPICWIPVQYADRLVLAGDPFQLPPTILSSEAISGGLQISLMERLMSKLGPAASRRLNVQYRMHENIMKFSSNEFYGGGLIADPSVKAHLLKDLPGIATCDLTSTPVDYIDTAGASFDESIEPNGESRFNRQEAELADRKVQALLETGLPPGEIAVITPYSAQARLLRELIQQRGLEIDSVDGFQGREKEAVIVSLVRSNPDGEVGFLEDIRRMNVALTRARRKLIVIGDSATIAAHPFYRRMLTYFDEIGAYHSVWEE
jgi:ATP-dependent RNA/DNA helicase IGHMBP2